MACAVCPHTHIYIQQVSTRVCCVDVASACVCACVVCGLGIVLTTADATNPIQNRQKRYRMSANVKQAVSQAASALQHFQRCNVKYGSTVQKLTTTEDTPELRQELEQLKQQCLAAQATLQDLLAQCGKSAAAVKVNRDAKRISGEFEASCRRASSLLRRSVRHPNTAPRQEVVEEPDAFNDAGSSMLQNAGQVESQQIQLQTIQSNRMDVELKLQQEKSEALQKVARDVRVVKDMMQDISHLVHEQGESIDVVEHNVEEANVRIESGTVELQKSVAYQQKKRKRMCCLLAILVLALIAILVPTLVLTNGK